MSCSSLKVTFTKQPLYKSVGVTDHILWHHYIPLHNFLIQCSLLTIFHKTRLTVSTDDNCLLNSISFTPPSLVLHWPIVRTHHVSFSIINYIYAI